MAKSERERRLPGHLFKPHGDVDQYLRQISEKKGKIYRLPTTVEFEYALIDGLKDKKNLWGNEYI